MIINPRPLCIYHANCADGLLAARTPYKAAACYHDTSDGRLFSLRSIEGGPDVSEIAKGYGGGGHKHAAGFKKPLNWMPIEGKTTGS